MKNKLNPLEELRQEKVILRKECAESEERLAEHWSYLSDNAGSLLFQSAMNAVLRKFGFGGLSSDRKQEEETSTSNSFIGGLSAYYPVIWDLVQPLLWRFIVKKVKSIFSGKKKKRKDDDD